MQQLHAQWEIDKGHPPRGECGLKYNYIVYLYIKRRVTLHAEGVD